MLEIVYLSPVDLKGNLYKKEIYTRNNRMMICCIQGLALDIRLYRVTALLDLTINKLGLILKRELI